ncbi:MFS transporter [Undibacterium sp. Dicai25W]|uniref:MFS transporter n=1 Tax=Undibacterium sp. Dicai25W TaxID=3413034 RepID=UPI003BEF5260
MFIDQTKKSLHCLFLIQFLAMGSMEMSAPFWAQHLHQMTSMSTMALAWASGMAYAGPMIMTMLCSPIWGKIGDRTGHKMMLVRALLALTVTQFWIAFSDDVFSILIARLLQGALAGFIATAQAYGSSLIQRDQRGTLMAHLQMATAIGSVSGPMVGGYIYGSLGFNQINLIAALICGTCTLATLFCLQPVNGTKKSVFVNAEENQIHSNSAHSLSPLLGMLFAIVLIQSAKMMPQVFFAIYADQVLHAPPWLTGACYGALAVGLCVAAPFWAKRFAHKSRSAVLREIEYCCWACAIILGFQALSHQWWQIVFSRIVWGVFLAALLPVFYSLLSKESSDAQQGWVLGLGNSAAKAGALAGIAIGSLGMAYLPVAQLFWPICFIYVLTAFVLRYQRQQRVSLTLMSKSI